MLITLYVFLFFVTYIQAGFIKSFDNTTSDSSSEISNATSEFAIDNELTKISTTCLNSTDYEMLAGNFIKHGTVRLISGNLVRNSAVSIGLAELRRALNFAPLRPWKAYNNTKPSEDELASASNIEAYYDLIEPIPWELSLDYTFFFEKNIATAITYLDERLPSIRYIYRRRFEEIRQNDEGLIDRKLVDRMRDELLATRDKMKNAIEEMLWNDRKCL